MYSKHLFDNNTHIIEMLPDVVEDMRYSHLTRKEKMANISPIRDSKKNPKIQRNELCPCGSKMKYKHCHGK